MQVVKEFDYAAELIKLLKSNGYKVYLLSNYARSHFELDKEFFIVRVQAGVPDVVVDPFPAGRGRQAVQLAHALVPLRLLSAKFQFQMPIPATSVASFRRCRVSWMRRLQSADVGNVHGQQEIAGLAPKVDLLDSSQYVDDGATCGDDLQVQPAAQNP